MFVVLLEGLDAVQIAVANRDCLSSPPFINKSAQLGRLSAATEEQQAGLSLYSEAFHVCPSLLFLCIFLSLSPKLTSLSHNSLPKCPGLSGIGPLTLAYVNLSGKQRVRVCTPPVLFFFFFWKKLSALFSSGGQTSLWERRGEETPPWCCDLTKQTAELGASSSRLLGQQSLASDSEHLRDLYIRSSGPVETTSWKSLLWFLKETDRWH